MKTLKLTMIAAILSFAMISYAGVEPTPPVAKKVVKITLTQALREPGLVNAMHNQLTVQFLQVEPQGLYVGTVRFNRVVYKIYGSRTAWIRFFFNTDPPIGIGTNNKL